MKFFDDCKNLRHGNAVSIRVAYRHMRMKG